MRFGSPMAASPANWPALARKYYVWLVMLMAMAIYLAKLPTFQVGSYVDDAWYITLAKSISSGQGYRRIELVGAPPTTAAPFGYPLLLAPLVYLFPHTYLPLQLLSILFALGAIYLFWAFLRRRVSALIAMLVLVLFAFHTGVVAFASMVRTEVPCIFFTMLALVLLDRYEAQRKALTWNLIGLTIAAAMAYFVRVPGLVLVGSIFAYLLCRRQFHKAAAFGVIVAIAVGLWSYHNWTVAGALISKEYEEWSFVPNPSRYLGWLQATVEDYVFALPHSLIPFLGPKTTHLLSALHPWLPSAFNLTVWGIVIAGFLFAFRHQVGAANIYVAGLMGVLLVFRSYGEDRLILQIVPFLYIYLVLGINQICHWALPHLHVPIRPEQVVLLCTVVVLLLNVARDVQGIVDPVRWRIPDVSLGATWIRDHSQIDAVIMARIPRVTFIYAERALVPYPDDDWDSRNFYGRLPELTPAEALIHAIERFGVDYLLIAPLIQSSAGPFIPQLDEYMQTVVLPTINSHPDQFRLVYNNPSQQVFVYEVQEQ